MSVPADSAGGALAVELALDGIAPDRPLVLEAFALSRELTIDSVSSHRPDGSSVATEMTTKDTPRLSIAAPGSSRLQVRYVARPGLRQQHSDHARQQRRCPSAVGRHLVLARGRDVFLLPDPPERMQTIAVSFDLPPGWRSFAPWNPTGSTAAVELHGRDAAEHLTGTPFALGDLRAEEFVVGSTRFQVVVERTAPSDRVAIAQRDIEGVARDLFDTFGRSLGPSYTVLAVTPSERGEEVIGDAWGTGQGATLIPLTTRRLQGFARRLADAFLEARPYRSEFRRASDYWVSVAASELFALEAAARVRGIADREVARYLISAYRALSEQPGDLETAILEHPGERTRHMTEVAGSVTLLALEHDVMVRRPGASLAGVASARAGTADESESDPLRDLFRRLVRRQRIDSFWSEIPSGGPRTPASFRERYVSGHHLPHLRGRDTLDLAPEPTPRPGPAHTQLRIAYTSQSLGYLENCGCKASQEGGLPRRSSAIRRLRSERTPLILLDAGSSLADPAYRGNDAWSLAEQDLYVSTVARMGYDAMALGATELSQPSAILRSLVAGPLPYVCANLSRGGRPLAPAFRRVRAGNIDCRVIGVYEPMNPLSTPPALEEGLDSLSVEDPVAAVAGITKSTSNDDLVIVVGELSPATASTIARIPGVDLVVTSQFEARGEPLPFSPRGELSPELSGFLGPTALAVGAGGQYAVDTLGVEVAPGGQVALLEQGSVELNDIIADDPAVRRRFDAFYADVARATAGAAQIEVPLADDPSRIRGRFLGAQACATCHATEHDQWLATPHAGALHTLVSVHRNYQPRCVACHVVALGAPSGYRMGGKTDHLGGVQCETCHGPGAEHAAAPSRSNILRAVPERVCLSCHTADHSDDFEFATKLPLVLHRQPGEALAAAAAAKTTHDGAMPAVRGTRSR